MAETELACSTDCGETEADSGMQVDLNSNEEGCDQDDSNNPDAHTNYDSSDGALLRCDRCDFEGMTAAALSAHTATCAGDDRTVRKMFECDVCQMKFSNGANMRRHKMRHTGVKPYECRVCQKRFFRKDHLAEHFTTHTKSLPFHCPICNRGFQRQIAMRAHFQNEHVGQNDVVKSCPLCSYRAGSMKSLRVHFFNRHGIDLDRPTNGGNGSEVAGGGGSDSGDSARSGDNATPPMHFLTPHVEISMADPPPPSYSPTPQIVDQEIGNEASSECAATAINGESPGSPQSGDSPSSSGMANQGEVTPSVSLIPIKQEAEEEKQQRPTANGPVNLSTRATPLASLIKVSPLKSLLREEVRIRERPSSTESTPAPDSVWRPPPSAPRRLHCPFCAIAFPDQTLYFLHKGCHSDSNPWKCNICGEQCSNVYDFNSHLLSKTHQ